jgi:hypothetical protein
MPFCCKCGLKVADADGFCTGCGIRLVNPQWIGEQRRAEEARGRTAKTRAYLRTSSISWFVVAAISFILPSFFSAGWGVVCVILGVLNLAFPSRSMLIVNGIGMMLAGVANFGGSVLLHSVGFWTGLGVMQIIWGLLELRRFSTGNVQT